ncbi:hypothetical protein GCM10017752_05500 [Streptomyces roseoviridis]
MDAVGAFDAVIIGTGIPGISAATDLSRRLPTRGDDLDRAVRAGEAPSVIGSGDMGGVR